MPELPEIETIKKDLSHVIVGRKIIDIAVFDPRVIRHDSATGFVRRLKGSVIQTVERRGKAIILGLKGRGASFIIQPMMAGQLIYSEDPLYGKATKVSFRLSNHHYLHYNDSRTFGRLQVVSKLDALKYFRVLGPEPLNPEFDVNTLKASLKRRAVPIKALLMDYSFVAGIGNIYASEILFCSGINPSRPAKNLVRDEIHALHRAIGTVLRSAIKERGTTMNSYRDGTGREGRYLSQLKVYGREGERCLHCGTPIVRIVLRGRSTFFCRNCQK